MGWYAPRQKTLDSLVEPGLYTLVAFVEYPLALPTEFVSLIIDETYFLQYNLAEDFNIDTTEMRDAVTITMPTDEGTSLIAGLLPGANFTVPDYKGTGLPLIIEACYERAATAGLGNAMRVAVGLGRSYCGDDEAPLDTGTAPRCMARHNPCIENDDCCDTLKCLGPDYVKVCSSCRPIYSECQITPDCCEGLSCESGLCRAAVLQQPLGVTVNTTSSLTSAADVTTATIQLTPTSSPSMPVCQVRKDECTSHVDCCGDLRCITMIHPKCRKCRKQNQVCSGDMDCCDYLHCQNGSCQPFR